MAKKKREVVFGRFSGARNKK